MAIINQYERCILQPFDVLDVKKHEKYGLGDDDIKGILLEYDKFMGNEIFPHEKNQTKLV